MVDVFLAKSVNAMIYNFNDKNIFSKHTSENLINLRNTIRNKYETIIVGANTIKNDNPTLLNKKQTNIRIIIDKYCDLDKQSKIFLIKPERTFLILLDNNYEYEKYMGHIGVNIIKLEKYSEQLLIDKIKDIAKGNILIEGGSKTIGLFLNNKFIDNFIIVEFPLLFPDESIPLCTNNINFVSLKLKKTCLLDDKYVFSIYKVLK